MPLKKNDFKYYFGKYPKNNLNDLIFSSCVSLERKLESLNIDKLKISDYNKRYFGGHISTKNSRLLNLTKYAYVISYATSQLCKVPSEITFLDYGGGHGTMSLLAKEMGIKKVIYCDIYEQSCIDAREIGKALEIEADEYIFGDINEVISQKRIKNFNIDSAASYDVIEHIYDVKDFLSKNQFLSDSKLSVFHASAANIKNPRINHNLRQLHKNMENYDRNFDSGRKSTDTRKALKKLRKQIIEENFSNFSKSEINKLVKLSRGLIKDEMIEKIKLYEVTNKYFSEIDDPTNTCDPLTGNWFEQLLDQDFLINSLNMNGFQSKIIPGFYDSPKNSFKSILKKCLNLIIFLNLNNGPIFSPYFGILGLKKND